jgi:hypothetical protein
LTISLVNILALAFFTTRYSTVDRARLEDFFDFFNGDFMLVFNLINDPVDLVDFSNLDHNI